MVFVPGRRRCTRELRLLVLPNLLLGAYGQLATSQHIDSFACLHFSISMWPRLLGIVLSTRSDNTLSRHRSLPSEAE